MNLSTLLLGGFKYAKKRSLHVKAETGKFAKEFLPAIWGNSTAQVSAFLPLALFAIATSTAIFPRVSRLIKQNNKQQALKYMQKAFWFLATVLMLSSLGGFILSREIVQILFQRGAFSINDTAHTSIILKMYMLGLLPYGLNKLFSLWLYAAHLQKKAARIASYSLISNIFFSLVLIKPMGAAGLALASSISSMHIYDSATKTKRKFTEQNKGVVYLYVCGPTVYDDAHLGHAKSALTFDLLTRVLKAHNLHVIYARNITDIDDKIIQKAKQIGISIQELTDNFTAKYHEDMARLGITPPDIEPKATRSIDAMTDMIKRLLDSGHAYKTTNGDIYFDVSSDKKC